MEKRERKSGGVSVQIKPIKPIKPVNQSINQSIIIIIIIIYT